MPRYDAVDDVSLMREIVRDACWRIAYHESELALAHKKLALMHGLLQRCGLDISERQAKDDYEDRNEDDDCATPQELASFLLGDALNTVAHHERELRGAHVKLAAAKALMLRTDIELPIDEIAEREHERVADR